MTLRRTGAGVAPVSPASPTVSTSPEVSMLSLLGGIAFIGIWLAGAAVWAVMSLMGGVMANDAGRVAAERHTVLLVVLMIGEILVALAGISGGSAIMVPALRSTLWWTFAGLLVVGLALQIGAVWGFLSAAA